MTFKRFEFTIPNFSIPFSNLYLTDTLRLNQFQKELYDLINNGKDVLAIAPPGGGKTLALLLNSKLGMLKGFVALYPNNTLLKNQMKTVEEILKEHFNAKPEFTTNNCKPSDVECIEPLRIYKIDPSVTREAWGGDKYVALLALSGKAIQSEPGIPKSEILYKLGEKVFSYRNEGIYTIVFSTIDTFLLVSTGAYMNFESVGKAVHNILLAIAREEKERIDDILRETKTLTRSKVKKNVAIFLFLLDMPLFIDEFHLYNPYEIDALYALLRLHREQPRSGLPVIFSSATPAEDIMNELSDIVKPEKIEARLINGGSDFQVKGDMHVIVIPVDAGGKEMSAFYKAVNSVPGIVESDSEILNALRSVSNGKALIIVDRLWMVSYLASKLREKGINVECIASITPKDMCSEDSNIIVGSEATTQGVNLGKVVLGVMSGTSSEDIIQRIGRVGRRGVNSTLYLIAPESALEKVESNVKSKMSYDEFVNWISNVYPNYPKRKKSVSNIICQYSFLSKARKKLIYTIGVVAIARTSGQRNMLNKINLTRGEAINLFNAIIAPPEMVARITLFRRSGFNVHYIVEGYNEEDTSSIGLITRNFVIKDVKEGHLIIRLDPARYSLAIRAEREPSRIVGRIIDLRTLLRLLNAHVSIDNDRIVMKETELIENTLTYVVDLGGDLADYLSYTGEGAEIISLGGKRYAIMFI